MQIQGFVTAINEKPTQFGVMYDIVVNGTKYGIGKFAPKGIAQGDYVQFDGIQKGQYWNVAPGSLSKQPSPAGVKPAPAPVSGGSGGYDKRQETISKQAALNSALTFVSLLNAADALPVAKSAKADKKADIVKQIVLEYTAEFYHMATGETYDLPDMPAVDLATVEEAGNWQE